MRNLLECPNMQISPNGPPKIGYRIYSADSLGQAIRHYRREAGLTQADLAKQSGLNRTYLSDLERGQGTEQVKRLLRVLRLLGVRMTLEKADW
jgi:DNA-binding XRE family transcriptional regulator